jgi:hypothetical protein
VKHRRYAAGLAAFTFLVPLASILTPAWAGGCEITDLTSACVDTIEGSVDIHVSERRVVARAGQPASVRNGRTDTDLNSASDAFCQDSSVERQRRTGTADAIEALCGFLPAGDVGVAVPGRGEVLRAFRELGLYRGVVRSDPGRASFVNLETYFWCGDATRTCAAIGEAERTVTLLGQAVRIRPRIVAYEWRFGDGGGVRTSAVRVAHVYDRAGAMAVSVTLTWTADYAVGGGGFGPVDGTTTTTSPVRVLPVQEVQAVAR